MQESQIVIVLITIGASFLFITIFNEKIDNNRYLSRLMSFIAGILFLLAGVGIYTGWMQKNTEKSLTSITTDARSLTEAIHLVELSGLSICTTKDREKEIKLDSENKNNTDFDSEDLSNMLDKLEELTIQLTK